MNWLVPLPVALPLLVAAALVAFSPVSERRITDFVSVATALGVTAACAWLMHLSSLNTIVYWFGDWRPRGPAAVGISFVIDPFGAGLAAFCGFLMTMSLIYTIKYFEEVRTYFHALMLLFLAAMTGFCLTGDLFNLFVFFELMSVTAYALTAYKVEEEQSSPGAFNFAVTNSIGGFLTLTAIGLIYGRTGALNMAQAGAALAHHPADALTTVALAFIFTGFFIKAAVAPFHFWLGDAHAVAPAPVCVLFSGVMIELGLYGAFRVYWMVFHPSLAAMEPRIRVLLMALGCGTAIVGATMCFLQRHLKRLLAFSSISHIGMMLTGAACLSAKGIAGAALYALGHGFVKGALFMGGGVLLSRFGSVDEIELAHRGKKLFVLATVFIIGGLGLAGFPPFGPYLGKQVMEEAAKAAGVHWFLYVFLFASMMTGGAVLRFAGIVFFGWARPTEESKSPTGHDDRETRDNSKAPVLMLTVMSLMVLAPVLMDLAGARVSSAVQAAAERFVDEPAYLGAVLSGHPTGALQVQPSTWHLKGLIEGLAAALGAAIVAALALLSCRLPKSTQRAMRKVTGPLQAILEKIHIGHVGDLVIWVMIGAVIIGAVLIW